VNPWNQNVAENPYPIDATQAKTNLGNKSKFDETTLQRGLQIPQTLGYCQTRRGRRKKMHKRLTKHRNWRLRDATEGQTISDNPVSSNVIALGNATT
tara:strand:- start:355 stop:645 length:291 start_codon:yes stop_codon:yes gene_type:complete